MASGASRKLVNFLTLIVEIAYRGLSRGQMHPGIAMTKMQEDLVGVGLLSSVIERASSATGNHLVNLTDLEVLQHVVVSRQKELGSRTLNQ